jgi:hypothetical protein
MAVMSLNQNGPPFEAVAISVLGSDSATGLARFFQNQDALNTLFIKTVGGRQPGNTSADYDGVIVGAEGMTVMVHAC